MLSGFILGCKVHHLDLTYEQILTPITPFITCHCPLIMRIVDAGTVEVSSP